MLNRLYALVVLGMIGCEGRPLTDDEVDQWNIILDRANGVEEGCVIELAKRADEKALVGWKGNSGIEAFIESIEDSTDLLVKRHWDGRKVYVVDNSEGRERYYGYKDGINRMELDPMSLEWWTLATETPAHEIGHENYSDGPQGHPVEIIDFRKALINGDIEWSLENQIKFYQMIVDYEDYCNTTSAFYEIPFGMIGYAYFDIIPVVAYETYRESYGYTKEEALQWVVENYYDETKEEWVGERMNSESFLEYSPFGLTQEDVFDAMTSDGCQAHDYYKERNGRVICDIAYSEGFDLSWCE